MMDLLSIIDLLWTTGHFRNPAHSNLHNLDSEDVKRLWWGNPLFVEAIQSYQTYFGRDLEQYVFAFHGRPLYPDGDIGPATELLLSRPRCMMPDFHVPDDPELDKLWAKEDANWPAGCRGELITGRSFSALPGLSKEETDAIWWAACHNWTEAIQDVQLSPGPPGQKAGTHFYADLERMSGGTLAWSFLARNSCSINLSQAYNSALKWNRRLAATVKTHEDGHALGMNHVGDNTATLYPSINQSALDRFGYPNRTDIKTLKSLGYLPYEDFKTRRPPEDKLWSPRGEDVPPGEFTWEGEFWTDRIRVA